MVWVLSGLVGWVTLVWWVVIIWLGVLILVGVGLWDCWLASWVFCGASGVGLVCVLWVVGRFGLGVGVWRFGCGFGGLVVSWFLCAWFNAQGFVILIVP